MHVLSDQLERKSVLYPGEYWFQEAVLPKVWAFRLTPLQWDIYDLILYLRATFRSFCRDQRFQSMEGLLSDVADRVNGFEAAVIIENYFRVTPILL